MTVDGHVIRTLSGDKERNSTEIAWLFMENIKDRLSKELLDSVGKGVGEQTLSQFYHRVGKLLREDRIGYNVFLGIIKEWRDQQCGTVRSAE